MGGAWSAVSIDAPLTCEACKAAPAEYLVVADFRLTCRRVKRMQCTRCADRERERSASCRHMRLYVFALTPVTQGARRG